MRKQIKMCYLNNHKEFVNWIEKFQHNKFLYFWPYYFFLIQFCQFHFKSFSVIIMYSFGYGKLSFWIRPNRISQKFRIREILNLSTDADSSTNTFFLFFLFDSKFFFGGGQKKLSLGLFNFFLFFLFFWGFKFFFGGGPEKFFY